MSLNYYLQVTENNRIPTSRGKSWGKPPLPVPALEQPHRYRAKTFVRMGGIEKQCRSRPQLLPRGNKPKPSWLFLKKKTKLQQKNARSAVILRKQRHARSCNFSLTCSRLGNTGSTVPTRTILRPLRTWLLRHACFDKLSICSVFVFGGETMIEKPMETRLSQREQENMKGNLKKT